MEKKFTKGPLELKYVSSTCIGIGTVDRFYPEMTANSIIPDPGHSGYDLCNKRMEADMRLYAAAPDLLEALEEAQELALRHLKVSQNHPIWVKVSNAIAKAYGKEA